jgi:hypothetical protein
LFQRLPGADALGPLLDTAVGTDDWHRREDAIANPELSALAVPAGGIEQWVDNVAVLSHAGRRAGLAAAYRGWLTTGS